MPSEYSAGSKKTGGGYRAYVGHEDGKEMYLGSAIYKTPKAAEGEAEVYKKAYFKRMNDRYATSQVADYRNKNKGHMKEEVEQEAYDRFAAQRKSPKGGKVPAPKSDMEKRLARGQRNDPVNKLGMKKEDNLDELSTKTLSSYINKASDARGHRKLSTRKVDNRYTGVHRASQKLAKREDVNEELTDVQKRKHKNLKDRAKGGNAQAKKRLAAFEKEFAKDLQTSKASATQMGKSSGKADTKAVGGADDHIVMQLRKAQDVGGNMDIKVSPTGKSVRLKKQEIDQLLKLHDKMQKPDEKRKFRILVTKKLRDKAK